MLLMECERVNELKPDEWEEVIGALWDAHFEPDADKVRTSVERALSGDGELWLVRNPTVVAALVCRGSNGKVVLDLIGTTRAFRGQGLGRRLLEALRSAFPKADLEAETDDDAVDFYRRCGFEVTLLPQRYPGVNRWHVLWPASPLRT